MTAMTSSELDQLAEIRPLQEKLNEQAERIFNAWHKANPLRHGTRYFQRAEVTGDGLIEIHFEVGSSCCGYEKDSQTFSFSDFTDFTD